MHPFHFVTLDVLLCLQLYDTIASKVVTPVRGPPSDAIQKARDVLDVLRDFEHRREVDYRDLHELQDLLNKPHLKVGGASNTFRLF